MRILGIDPGSDTTGWGVIESDGARCRMLGCGIIRSTAAQKFPARLLRISNAIEEIIHLHQPEACAIEDGFLATNVKVTLKLGQVRGVTMLAAERAALDIFEYSPRLVKQTVVGHQLQGCVSSQSSRVVIRVPAFVRMSEHNFGSRFLQVKRDTFSQIRQAVARRRVRCCKIDNTVFRNIRQV